MRPAVPYRNFTWVLERLSAAGLVRGKTVGIDATTLEANAAMRSIERRDTGESHEGFIRRLAEASGVETPTRAELARFDRQGVSLSVLGAVRAAGIHAVARWARSCRTERTRAA